jgi:hypothetical protein
MIEMWRSRASCEDFVVSNFREWRQKPNNDSPFFNLKNRESQFTMMASRAGDARAV